MSNLTEGKFRARAIPGTAKLGVAGTGTDQVGVEIEFLDGPGAGERRTWYGTFTDATAQRTIESLKYMGFDGRFTALAESVGANGEEFEAVVEWDSYNGKDQLKVRWINAIGQGVAMKTVMDAQGVAAFQARMQSTLAQVFGTGGAPARPAPRQAPAARPAPERPASPPAPSESGHPGDELGF